jgi:hypothetical protein
VTKKLETTEKKQATSSLKKHSKFEAKLKTPAGVALNTHPIHKTPTIWGLNISSYTFTSTKYWEFGKKYYISKKGIL